MTSRNPEPRQISVLLVDDHALVRQGFRRMLEDDPRIRVVGEAGDGPGDLADLHGLDARRKRNIARWRVDRVHGGLRV